MPALVLSAVNRKGGVGKTSTAFHLAGHFAGMGLRVLLLDNDPQHSLTAGIVGVSPADDIDPAVTVAALFDDQMDPLPEEIIRATPFDNISIVCGSDALTRFNVPEVAASSPLQFALRDFVQEVRDDFDLVLIDNSPTIQLCTIASLVASHFALCISQPEDYGSQGAVPVQHAIDQVLQTSNPELRFAGYLLNMVNRRLSIHKAYEQLLRKLYGQKVCRTVLPLSVHFKEAIAARKPVTLYRPKSAAALAIHELGAELAERMARLRALPPEFQYAGNRFYPGTPECKQSEVV